MTEDVKLLLEGLRFCRSHMLCEGCPLEKKCLDKDSDFDVVGASVDQIEALAAEIEVVIAKLETTTLERDAAMADINMCCPCEVCTRSCKYDKVNPYDECADFEWRGLPEPPKEEE